MQRVVFMLLIWISFKPELVPPLGKVSHNIQVYLLHDIPVKTMDVFWGPWVQDYYKILKFKENTTKFNANPTQPQNLKPLILLLATPLEYRSMGSRIPKFSGFPDIFVESFRTFVESSIFSSKSVLKYRLHEDAKRASGCITASHNTESESLSTRFLDESDELCLEEVAARKRGYSANPQLMVSTIRILVANLVPFSQTTTTC